MDDDNENAGPEVPDSMTESRNPPLAACAMGAERRSADAGLPAADGRQRRARFVQELFDRHRAALLRHLTGLLRSRADAEDVLQEAYARLLGVGRLDRSRVRARAYLFTIATNLAYDTFRARKSAAAAGAAAHPESDTPEQAIDFEQGMEVVRRTLLDLKPRCRRVFLMRAAEGLGYAEIARRLGVSTRTAEREMKRALEACQRRLAR